MISTKLAFLSVLITWSACGGGWIVNHVHEGRGVVIVKEVRYEPNPFASEVEKYAPLMEQLLGNRMASPPENIRRSPDERQVSVTIPLPRPRPVRSHGRTIEDVITLAEAGL